MPSPLAIPLAVSRSAVPLVALSLGATLFALRTPAPKPTPPPAIAIAMPVPPIAPSTDLRTVKSPCDDPLVGTWVARTFRVEHGDWHRYTLRITPDHAVTMRLEDWVASAGDTTIPQCSDGSRDLESHHIAATLTVDDARVRIDARGVESSNASACTNYRGYSLDHFAGSLDHDGSLAMLNTDDGGNAHDRPYTFRRISCP